MATIRQRLAIGGPHDGRIISTPLSPDPDHLTVEGGRYRLTRMSANVQIWLWIALPARFARRLRTVDWGVHKHPFGRVKSSR